MPKIVLIRGNGKKWGLDIDRLSHGRTWPIVWAKAINTFIRLQSSRKACIGSIETAFRAGRRVASNPIADNTTATAT